MNDPNIKIGQIVWWAHCSNKVYKGTVEEYSFCEYQGALYLIINSPTFKLNPYPCVHYSHCFTSKDRAVEFVEDLKKEGTFCKRCDRCEFEHRVHNYSSKGEKE